MKIEELYIRKRLQKARLQSIFFYLNRIFPIKKNKIVFTCIEGTTGYSCNPKYIAEEMMRKKRLGLNPVEYELVWLVDNINKKFPKEIKVYKNTLLNRAHQLSTAKIWIDNSRKQLECRKRKGQIYIQTWHAKLGFKPTCLDRGASFSKIAYLVSKHDSDMVDFWLSNSVWYDGTLKTGSLYEGKILHSGSPRCDVLVDAKNNVALKREIKKRICENNNIRVDDSVIEDIHFLMYAPTFRGGSQETNRKVEMDNHFPEYHMLREVLQSKFGGKWYILFRLHPQLVARNLEGKEGEEGVINVSRVDDMYELLAGCDAFITDYSSAAFDAMIVKIPVFLYCNDYSEYENERGTLLWNLKSEEIPFSMAEDDRQLNTIIEEFDESSYGNRVEKFILEMGIEENGTASKNVVDFIDDLVSRRAK